MALADRTYLLPGPRLPCAKFDVPCNQLVPSCKRPENIILVWQNIISTYYSRAFSLIPTTFKLILLKWIWRLTLNFVFHFSLKSGELICQIWQKNQVWEGGMRKCICIKYFCAQIQIRGCCSYCIIIQMNCLKYICIHVCVCAYLEEFARIAHIDECANTRAQSKSQGCQVCQRWKLQA